MASDGQSHVSDDGAAPRRLLWCCGLIALASVVGQGVNFHLQPIRSDGLGYWEFLPALLQYHDPWLARLQLRPSPRGTRFDFDEAMVQVGPERFLIKYPMGTALCWAPFYALAHLYCRLDRSVVADSYSWPFQAAVDVAATVYLIAGLLLLYRLAGRHGVSAQGRLMSLIAIVFGTNLFHYSTYDACFSHVPAFFGVCVWLTALEAYVARPHWARAAAVGAGAGLVLLGRYTNAVLLLLLAAYWLQARKAAPTPAWHLAVAGLAATLVLSPQLLYNRLGSGSWFFQGYAQRGEGFIHWSRPRFGEVLTSDEHGILLYCPILMPALVEASLRVWHGQDRWLFASVLGVAAIQAYILASWWWPGLGGFSQRGFAEYQALAYLPLALAYDRVRRGPARAAARPGVVLCCLYTTCLMLRYWWF